jgi:hypothetical protein
LKPSPPAKTVRNQRRVDWLTDLNVIIECLRLKLRIVALLNFVVMDTVHP